MSTILIVDDLAANREVVVSLLRYQGHRLLEATDGEAALRIIGAEAPDLVITDVLMPVMDGYELVRRLRLNPSTASIPVVFYTAHYGEREARALALASGVSYVLVKPAEAEEVLRLVALALAGHSEAEPPGAAAIPADFDQEHLRLLTDKLSGKAEDLKTANARLRALINIGMELASERDSDGLLVHVCETSRDLFGATFVTLGVLDRIDGTIRRFLTCGAAPGPWCATGGEITGMLHEVVAGRVTLRGGNPEGRAADLDLPPGHPDVHDYLVAPIASPAHVYGWLFFAGNEGRPFTAEDEQLALALAGQVGRIYENGYFYSVAQQRAEALEREVADRKRAEVALRQERDRAQRYLDTATVMLIALDAEIRVTLANRYACSLLGRSADELVGRSWIDTCLPSRLRDGFRETFARLLSGELTLVENPVLTASGEERMIEWRNTVLRDEDGQVIGVLSSGSDVTERHQAIDALRTAEERMRLALQTAEAGIWDMDYTTGVLRWSETLEAQHGLPPGAFAGSLDAHLAAVHPEDREQVRETLRAAAESGADFSLRNRSVWPDGTIRWLSSAGRVLVNQRGEPVRGVGISLDVTERHILEQQYLQAQKMEAVGRLAGGIAHDFNNLLTAILGYCELLLADFDENDPRRTDITEIHKAGASAAGLTRQLLAFSRKQIIQPTLIDVNTVVGDLRALLGRLIGEDVHIVHRLRPGLAKVQADRGQVEQIVMNLAVNARDAMPTGGTLTIETANVTLDEHYARTHLNVQPGDYVVLTVTDTGTGMSPDTQARLFEPFFTTKEPGKGTGLGLATVHGIVKQSGGSVGVYSEVGRGTAFKVYFPTATGTPTAIEEAPPVQRPRLGSVTVLVVEDADGLRELTRRLLERQGHTALVAASAEEALRLFDETPSIDVLLTDVVMPGASGPELTRQLIERRPGLKVIYMSGYTEDAIVHHGVIDPGVAFLHKPFTADALGRKVREVLDT